MLHKRRTKKVTYLPKVVTHTPFASNERGAFSGGTATLSDRLPYYKCWWFSTLTFVFVLD